MAYSLVVTGSSGTYDLVTAGKLRKATLSRNLGNEAATLNIDCQNLTESHCMDTITLTFNGTVRFIGTVKLQNDFKQGNTKFSTLECVDNTDKLHRVIVAEAYTNKTPKEIITALIAKYASWVTTVNVKDIVSAIETIRFDYVTLGTAIQNISEIAGAYWNLDENDDLHFFADNDGDASINYDASSNILKESFELETTAQELANRVWIIGTKAASTTYVDQYWTGDGNNAQWAINYEPNYPEVFEGGAEKTIEVDKGTASTKDYTYDKKNRVLKRTAGALGSGVSLKLSHRPTVQVIDYFEDPRSVSKYGLYEKVIKDRKITDKAAARKRGRAELKKTKAIQNVSRWQTREFWGIAPGKTTTLTVTSMSASGQYLITGIDVELTPADVIAAISAREVV